VTEPPGAPANPPGAPRRIKNVDAQAGRVTAAEGPRLAGRGMAAGIIAGFVGVAVGYLVGGIVNAASGPVAAVGESAIGLTPSPVREAVIRAFGTHDKTVLLAGIYVVLVIYAAAVGVLAVRRLRYGMAGIALFMALGLAAALTRPTATAAWALPTLAGSAAAALALVLLARAAAAPLAARVGGEPGELAPRTGLPADEDQPAEPAPGAKLPADEGQPGEPAPETKLPAGEGHPGEPTPGSKPPARAAASQQWEAPADWPPLPETLPVRSRRDVTGQQPPRRTFLVRSTALAGAAAVAYFGGRLLTERSSVSQAQASLRIPRPSKPAPPLPAGSDLRIPGLTPFITPNASFYRVDTAIVLPEIPPDSWQLRIHGMVAREITLTFDELIRRPLTADYITLTCVSNPVGGPLAGNALWVGAPLASLLREAGIQAGATQLLCSSAEGFTSGTPVQTVMDGRDALLAVAMNGTALPVAHGFPVRLVVPGLYGYVSACKWITDIEVTTFGAAAAYWVQNGWDQQAPIKTESRIDVPNGNRTLSPGRTAVAGVAWAQHKGIAAVEVQVDDGPWQEAQLAAVPDIDTWRQWVWYWDATPGAHLIQARATDATGYTQTAQQVPPEPNAATGYPMVQVNVASA
jgi:DMSO/TMAO reductase YedYZ molybdopterin-dependent catalytic subunit